MGFARKIQIQRAPIRADRHPGNPHHGFDIFLAHRVVYAVNIGAFFEDDVKAGWRGIFTLNFGDLCDGFSLEGFERWGVEARADDSFPAAVFIDVLIEFRIGHDPLAKSRAVELLDDLAQRRVLYPARKKPAPGVLHCSVWILVRRDLEPLLARLVDLLDDLTYSTPI